MTPTRRSSSSLGTYIDPLRDTLDIASPDVFYLFADTGGIGEQMGGLKHEIEAAE